VQVGYRRNLETDDAVVRCFHGRTATVYSHGFRRGIRWRYNDRAAAGIHTATGNPTTVSGTQAVSHGVETLPPFITTAIALSSSQSVNQHLVSTEGPPQYTLGFDVAFAGDFMRGRVDE
jgi:hypothetical protein